MELTRRQLLLAVGAEVVLGDQAAGIAYRQTLRNQPEVGVISAHDSQSSRTLLVAGGFRNDGSRVGQAMRSVLLPQHSIVAVRYAETNVDPAPLTRAIKNTLDSHMPPAGRLDAYLGSAAGIIMAEPIRRLGELGVRFGTVILDCAPCNANDIYGPLGWLARTRLSYYARHSRLANGAMIFGAQQQIPHASDKEARVPMSASEAHRSAIVWADTISSGVEGDAIRRGVAPHSMAAIDAERVVFVHATGQDPLINNPRALEGWRAAWGRDVEEFIDPGRPENSHAAGPTYPTGILKILQNAA